MELIKCIDPNEGEALKTGREGGGRGWGQAGGREGWGIVGRRKFYLGGRIDQNNLLILMKVRH